MLVNIFNHIIKIICVFGICFGSKAMCQSPTQKLEDRQLIVRKIHDTYEKWDQLSQIPIGTEVGRKSIISAIKDNFYRKGRIQVDLDSVGRSSKDWDDSWRFFNSLKPKFLLYKSLLPDENDFIIEDKTVGLDSFSVRFQAFVYAETDTGIIELDKEISLTIGKIYGDGLKIFNLKEKVLPISLNYSSPKEKYFLERITTLQDDLNFLFLLDNTDTIRQLTPKTLKGHKVKVRNEFLPPNEVYLFMENSIDSLQIDPLKVKFGTRGISYNVCAVEIKNRQKDFSRNKINLVFTYDSITEWNINQIKPTNTNLCEGNKRSNFDLKPLFYALSFILLATLVLFRKKLNVIFKEKNNPFLVYILFSVVVFTAIQCPSPNSLDHLRRIYN